MLLISLMGRVSANGLGDLGSIPDCFIAKIKKLVLDTFLLNTQHNKVCITGKVEQSNKKRDPSGHPQLQSPTFLLTIY